MTAIFTGYTADKVWVDAYYFLVNGKSEVQESRLGGTRETLHANFHIENPRQRWVLSRIPAFNPAFAIAEVFWILAGHNDSAFLNYWNPVLPKYAGHGEKYHGAYGYRIRKQFGFDQMNKAYQALKAKPSSRQVIIQIWDPINDFPKENGDPVDADIPCNICSMPKIRNNKLEWLQVMRSNDLYLGTPYNFIQFSTLQEILAGWLGIDVGAYHQVSDSLHIYENNLREIYIDESIEIPKNYDNLSVSKEAFDQLLKIMIYALYELNKSDISKHHFRELLSLNGLNPSYNNLLAIAAADSARRRGWIKEMEEAKESCTNDLLKMAFARWENRYPIDKKIPVGIAL